MRVTVPFLTAKLALAGHSTGGPGDSASPTQWLASA